MLVVVLTHVLLLVPLLLQNSKMLVVLLKQLLLSLSQLAGVLLRLDKLLAQSPYLGEAPNRSVDVIRVQLRLRAPGVNVCCCLHVARGSWR